VQLSVAPPEASDVSNCAPLAAWASGTAEPAEATEVAARWRAALAASPRLSVELAVPAPKYSFDMWPMTRAPSGSAPQVIVSPIATATVGVTVASNQRTRPPWRLTLLRTGGVALALVAMSALALAIFVSR
jgi:hypothetical protein